MEEIEPKQEPKSQVKSEDARSSAEVSCRGPYLGTEAVGQRIRQKTSKAPELRFVKILPTPKDTNQGKKWRAEVLCRSKSSGTEGSKKRAKRQFKIQRSKQDDKKNTKKPKRHAEVSTSVPRPICEEKHEKIEASYRGDASVPRHQRLSTKRHNSSRVSLGYF